MDLNQQLKLEIETRRARDMCSVLSKDELTDLIVSMYRADYLKNEWIKTFFMGDFYGTSDELTDEEANQMALWITSNQ